MYNKRRVILLGIDGLPKTTLNRFIVTKDLPNFKHLLKNGSLFDLISTLPPLTCPAWMSIASGAHPGTIGIHNILMPQPGHSLDHIQNGFDSTLSRVEYIWEAMACEDRKAIIIKYPGSWPPRPGNFIQVDGSGGYADITCKFEVVSSAAYFTNVDSREPNEYSLFPVGYKDKWRIDTLSKKGKVNIVPRNPVGWKDIPERMSPEMEIVLPIDARESTYRKFLFGLAGRIDDKPCLLVRSNKQSASEEFILFEKKWSRWIDLKFGDSECFIRLKLITLDLDRKHLHIYRSQGHDIRGFTKPEILDKELLEELGPVVEWTGTYDIMNGLIDLDTQYEIYEAHTDWLIRTMTYLGNRFEWDGIFTQWHSLEYAHHIIGASLYPEHPKHDPKLAPSHMNFLKKVYQLADKLLGAAISLMDDDTLLLATGDHGHDLVHTIFYINHFLFNRGWLKYNIESEKISIDWANTSAYAHFPGFIYFNRKSTWKGGILNDNECTSLEKEIIRALKEIKNPLNGENPIKIILNRNELNAYGHSSSSLVDLYFSMERGYEPATRLLFQEEEHIEFEVTAPLKEVTSGHGSFFPASPSAKTVSIFYGREVKKGFVGDYPINTIDICPTLTRFMGIRDPLQCEGKCIPLDTVKHHEYI